MTRVSRRHSATVIPCLAVLLAGCYSTATLHTARPIEPGEVRGAVAMGTFVGEENGDFAVLPTLEGQMRFGVMERLDVGVHITNLGVLGVDANFAVLLSEDQAVSIDPAIEFSYGTYVWLPVLWDFYHSENLTLTGSLRGGRYWLQQDDGGEDFLLDDLEADVWLYGPGLAAQVRISDAISLAPELRVLWADRTDASSSPPLVSVSLGLIF